MHKNQLFVLITLRSLFNSLALLLALALLPGCQSLPQKQDKQDASNGVKHEFSFIKQQSVFGQLGEVEVESGDSLPVIARYFGLGFDEIALANPKIDPWLPESGDTVKLPLRFILPDAPRKGLVLNLNAKRLFYFPKNRKNKVITFPIGIGRKGWKTPTGKTRVIAKKKYPRWVVPKSILLEHKEKGDPLPRIVKAGPNNPLGDYAIRLGIPGYLIHGTNKPYGVGMAVSHGCVRLYPEDIEILFKHIKTNMPVRLLHQPFLIGWDKGELYIQAYQTMRVNKKQNRRRLATFKRKLKRIERGSKRQIDWQKVERVLTQRKGIPIPVFTHIINNESVIAYRHPVTLDRKVNPLPLIDESWRIKVTDFPDTRSAKRFSVMLNHQGPPIPAHVESGNDAFIVISGPFDSVKKAKNAMARLRIDFGLNTELIEPGKDIPGLSNNFFNFF